MAKKPDEPAPAAPAPSSTEKLRAFEDKVVGADAPRPGGEIEKGIGSIWSRISDAHKAHHAALQAVIDAETEHEAASKAADAAHAKLQAAIKKAQETEGALS